MEKNSIKSDQGITSLKMKTYKELGLLRSKRKGQRKESLEKLQRLRVRGDGCRINIIF